MSKLTVCDDQKYQQITFLKISITTLRTTTNKPVSNAWSLEVTKEKTF